MGKDTESERIIKRLSAENAYNMVELDRAKAYIRKVNGKIKSLPKRFKLTEETAMKLSNYWKGVAEKIKECKIEESDNFYEAICKAYILSSGREENAFKILREKGFKIYHSDNQYEEYFLPTIFPKESENDIAGENISDKTLLKIARELGEMRNSGY